MEETDIRHFCDAKITEIYEGTSEIRMKYHCRAGSFRVALKWYNSKSVIYLSAGGNHV